MRKVHFLKKVPMLLLAAGVVCAGVGLTGHSAIAVESKMDSMAEKNMVEGKVKPATNIYKGKIKGFSKKAKTISIEVGKGDKAKTMMVKFDDSTKGTEHAKKGDAAIISFEMRGNDKVATIIKPKLAKLPEGVTEMMPAELMKLVAMGTDAGKYFLVDSRPAKRFAEGHIPTSVSIPVAMMKKKGADMLPADKDSFIIFHCGGPT